MAKVKKVLGTMGTDTKSRRGTPYPLATCRSKVPKYVDQNKKQLKASDRKEWDDATCSVCMEYPHNAVLLLCSSYNKGCRPYMCATSYRYSNCLEQYKKAYTKVNSTESGQPWHGSTDDPNFGSGLDSPDANAVAPKLLCPLCRGQVKGWTVVEPARTYFNKKRRTCMQENCSFVGTYRKLRKHVKAEHPWARPREVDPSVAEKWKKLEHDRERNDVISTIRSSMPDATIMGDYVIEDGDYLDDFIYSFEPSYWVGWNRRANPRGATTYSHGATTYSRGVVQRGYESWDEDNFDDDYEDEEDYRAGGVAAAGHDNYNPGSNSHSSRLLLGASRRQRRHRTGNVY